MLDYGLNNEFMIIWDIDWIKNRQRVVNLIVAKLGLGKKIHARSTEVRSVAHTESVEFLEHHHRSGAAAASVRLGLYDGPELVALLTLGRPRFNRNIEWEVIRFCVKGGVNVVGGFSKLFKSFERLYTPQSVCTYADCSTGHGAVYQQAGFEAVRNTRSGYFWCNGGYRVLSRWQTQRKNLPQLLGSGYDPRLTEAENMQAAGYFKCEDVGNIYFERFF